MNMNKKESGDYQTPINFSDKICSILLEKYSIQPHNVIEPTMGVGNFLFSTAKIFKKASLFGIEINKNYIDTAIKNGLEGKFFCENIFNFDFNKVKDEFSKYQDPLLLIGNPPWVTNSSLSSLDSLNLPFKDNFKQIKGFDAVTGKANFDICEYIILQLLSEFQGHNNCYLAFLCKEIVVKNIIRDLEKYDFKLEFSDVYKFNAMKVFSVNCDAVLFVAKLSTEFNCKTADVYDIINPYEKKSSFGWVDDKFISDIRNYIDDFDGECQFKWRQGVKHDCSKVMEITMKEGHFFNGYKEEIDFVNSDNIYPLVKSSGFKTSLIKSFNKFVIVTQHYVREDTSYLKKNTKLYSYLLSHSDDFNKRKSIIYKNTPQFSMFGIGDYSFYKYKIGISGFYKEPKFSYLCSSKPVMVDDTCYFIGTNDKIASMILFSLLDTEYVYDFLKSISFINSKRPFTKDVLQRLDIYKIYKKYTPAIIIKKIKEVFNENCTEDSIYQFEVKLKDNSY